MPQRHPRPARRRRRRYVPGPHVVRRGRWYYAYLPGQPRRALHTTDERTAYARFRDLHERGRAPGTDPRPQEAPLAEIADCWLGAPHGWTRRTQMSCEARALAFVRAMEKRGVRLPSQITAAILDAWRQDRMAKRQRSTINRDEVVARRMLLWAAHPDRALCERTPLEARPQLREPRRDQPPIIPSPREVARVVAALQARADAGLAAADTDAERARAAGYQGAALTLATALATGLRLDELRHLTADDLHDGAVHVRPEVAPAAEAWTTKGYRARAVPVDEASLDVARAFVAWRSGKGGRGKPVGLSDTWIADRIDEGCADAKVEAFRMHDLRRTFATENRRAGHPITVIRDWMGHRDTQTTERYLGRYRDDATLQVATSPALAVLKRAPAPVLPLRKK